MVWLAVASILAAFDIGKDVDAQGKEVPSVLKFTAGFFQCACRSLLFQRRQAERFYSRPIPFKCQIKPRTPELRSLILKTAEEHAAEG